MIRCLLFAGLWLPALQCSWAVDFAREIRPVLSDHCFQCHGPDEEQRQADLRLDTEDGIQLAFAGGQFDESEAWRRIHSIDPDEQMPPPSFGKPLSSVQLQALQSWMQQGAPWSQHWAFAPLTRTEPPAIEGLEHPLDRFVAAKLREHGLTLSRRAEKTTLIRRLKLDLVGLPPTLEEIDDFLADDSPAAYEKLVEQFLASPHFGERMALQWLDGARYADTNGYQNDFGRSMWPWRDWVIGAFNENLPYDQFVIAQLAGDMLPEPTLDQRIATGFNRNNRTVTEFGSLEEEWLVENVVDRVETTSTVFLGLTMGCARCHDHKYDPISQRDFYKFFAFFHNVTEKGVYPEQRGNVDPRLPVLTAEHQQQLNELKQQLADTELTLATLEKQLPKAAANWQVQSYTISNRDSLRLPLETNLLGTTSDGGDLSPSQQTGKVVWLDTLLGGAAHFSGLHKLYYGQAISPDLGNPFTLSFWLRPQKDGPVLDKFNLEEGSRGFDVFWKKPGTLEAHFIHFWPIDGIKISTRDPLAVPPDHWAHISLTYDGSNKATGIQLYVNGHSIPLKVESDNLKKTFANEEPLRIAGRARGQTFFGTLKDVRYSEGVLDRDAVLSIANEGLAQLKQTADAEQASEWEADRTHLFAEFAEYDLAKQFRAVRGKRTSLEEQLKELEANHPTVMVMEERAEPRPTYVLRRGEYDKPDTTQQVSAELPKFLGKLPDDAKRDRLALARWIVSSANPLTPRVRVNRLWQMLFGMGLVKTSENFGVQAEPPSHPELLDWLATEFVRLDWDQKALLKVIVTSETYRQSSLVTPELLERDAENRLLARGPRFRLDSELIRDNALAVSGLLTKKIGGPSMKPYQPAGLWDELAGGAGEGKYVQSTGDDLYRRSMYIYRKRTVPHPVTNTFDAPSWEVCQVARARTNTPLQALALLNDTTYVEAARKLAERMLRADSTSVKLQIQHGFRLCTGRVASDAELDTLVRRFEQQLAWYSSNPQAADELLSHGEAPLDSSLVKADLAAMSTVASVLLNLDETITKE